MTADEWARKLNLVVKEIQAEWLAEDVAEARDRAAMIEIPAYLKKGYTGLVNEFGDALCPNCRSDNFAVVDGHCDEVGCRTKPV